MTAPLSSISVAQCGHELVMLLSQPLKYKDYRGTPPFLAITYFKLFDS